MTHVCRRLTDCCLDSASPTPGSGFFRGRRCQTDESGKEETLKGEKKHLNPAEEFGLLIILDTRGQVTLNTPSCV